MKNLKLAYLIFFLPWVLSAEEASVSNTEDPFSDAVVVEDTTTPTQSVAESQPAVRVEPAGESRREVEQPRSATVEIPVPPIAGVRRENGTPPAGETPVVTTTLPETASAVLELPGQRTGTGATAMASEESISVDFPDEDVRTILRNVADLFDLNLVIPDTLQGRTSLKLRNVTWRQVFNVVLEPLGFTHVADENIIRIRSIAELTAEPVDTRVFIVNYARANELQGSIAPLVDTAAGGRIQVDTRSNALVITERPSQMNRIQAIIERLDRATDQVMIESKFIEVQNTDLKNIGVNWASLDGYRASAGPFNRNWERLRSSESESTSSSGRTSGTTSETSDGSVNGNPNAIPEVFEFGSTLGTTSGALSSFASNAATGRFDTAVFSAAQFELVLSALQSTNEVKLVANPTVVTLDNKKATIDIAEFFPNPQFSFNAQTGARQLDGVDIDEDGIRVGILLAVTPQVNAAGFINLDIEPTVSRSDRTVVIEGSEFPIIDKRTTKTSVMIKDGYTLAIGGLVENAETKGDTKVPVLGNLPGVGRLFRSNSSDMFQRNLIIFITARTLNPDGSTYRDVIDPRVLDQMQISPSQLPGYVVPDSERALLQRLEDERNQSTERQRIENAEASIQAIEKAREQALMQEQSEKGSTLRRLSPLR